MLAAGLRQELSDRVSVDILNLYLGQSAEECAKKIAEFLPDCIGFSVYIWNRVLTLQIIEILKERNPAITVFVGGPEVSADPSDIMKSGTVDFVLPGEGEKIVIQAVKELLAGTLPADIGKNIPSSPIEDLAKLPSPFLDGIIKPRDYKGMLWELSRGCPFKCDFCYESRGTSGVRRFPMDRIEAELKLFHKDGVSEVFVLDPTFNFSKKTAKDILRLIKQEAPETYFFFEVRAEFIDEELAELFASINATLQIGIQSASDAVLKKINRTINKDSFAFKILMLHEAGAVYGFDLIYGLPGDTLQGFCDSIDFAMGLMPNHIDLFPLTVLRGTRLYDTAASLGLEFEKENPYKAICTPQFSKDDMSRAAEISNACDLFYNKGEAVAWFNIILGTLKINASDFFAEFADWLKSNPEKSLLSSQLEFTAYLLKNRKKSSVIPIVSDIIAYFGYTQSLDGSDVPYSFTYNPDDIIEQLDYGVTDLKKLAAFLQSCS